MAARMRTYKATFWRGNPQLDNGGYYTERTIKAGTINSARNKAKVIERSCIYGSMRLVDIILMEVV